MRCLQSWKNKVNPLLVWAGLCVSLPVLAFQSVARPIVEKGEKPNDERKDRPALSWMDFSFPLQDAPAGIESMVLGKQTPVLAISSVGGWISLYSMDVRDPGRLLAKWRASGSISDLQLSQDGRAVQFLNKAKKQVERYDFFANRPCEKDRCGVFEQSTAVRDVCSISYPNGFCLISSADASWRAKYRTQLEEGEKPSYPMQTILLESPATKRSFQISAPQANVIFFSKDGSRVGAFFDNHRKVILWDLSTGKPVFEHALSDVKQNNTEGYHRFVRLLPDGKTFLMESTKYGETSLGHSSEVFLVSLDALARETFGKPVWGLPATYKMGELGDHAPLSPEIPVENIVAKKQQAVMAASSFALHVYMPLLDLADWHFSADGKAVVVVVPVEHFANEYVGGRATVGYAGPALGYSIYLWSLPAAPQQSSLPRYLFSKNNEFRTQKPAKIPLDVAFSGSNVLINGAKGGRLTSHVFDVAEGRTILSAPVQAEKVQWYPGINMLVAVDRNEVCAPAKGKKQPTCTEQVTLHYWPVVEP